MLHASAGSRGSGLLDVGIDAGVDEGMGIGIGAVKGVQPAERTAPRRLVIEVGDRRGGKGW